jgi:hypothetical protein
MIFAAEQTGREPAGEISSEAACFRIRMEQKVTNVGLRKAASRFAARVLRGTYGPQPQAPKQTRKKREPDDRRRRREQDNQNESDDEDDLWRQRALHP